jgi:hypothetical protein
MTHINILTARMLLSSLASPAKNRKAHVLRYQKERQQSMERRNKQENRFFIKKCYNFKSCGLCSLTKEVMSL